MGSGSPEPAAGAPRFSVVIACLDAADVLAGQLAALTRQSSHVPVEVLVCDNGSSDDTVRVALSWADRLPLRVLDASALPGAGPARNVGAAAARGEWLIFCDADDEVDDGWLAAMVRALAVHDFVAGRLDGERLNPARVLRTRRLDQQDGLQMSSTAIGLPHAGAGNLGIRREVFLAVGGFDPTVRHLEDTDLCWRIQRTGVPLVFDPDALVHVRLRPTLGGMYRQGWSYGAAQAELERRHAPVRDVTADVTLGVGAEVVRLVEDAAPPAALQACAPVDGGECGSRARGDDVADDGGLRAALRRAGAAVRREIAAGDGVGARMWRLGWYVGHRHGSRA